MFKLGRLEPENREYEQKYALRSILTATATTVEKQLIYPYSLRWYYDQGGLGACTGFSASIMMSIYNHTPLQKYDAVWLYRRAQELDNNPYTDPSKDTGSYVWAAFKALQTLGHKKESETAPDIKDGIESYYWGTCADDARMAIRINRPVVLGINWYESFFYPKTIKGEYWIGNENNWGAHVGGHAIVCYQASDKRQAVRLNSSWGVTYPAVWLPYKSLDRLMKENGEMCVAVDLRTNT